MAINLTDSLNAATTKGKLGDAKQVYLNGDTKNLQQAYEETSTHFGTLDNRSTQMEKAIQDISATGGASTANAVSYNNSTSKLGAITAQGAIDELANKKLNKENIAQEFGDSKDKVVSQFALPFREIESSEFIKAIVDTEDHFLFGIQIDGSIEWGKGIPAPIRTKLHEIINQCQKDKTDILEAINAAKEELSASITALQEGKVDKEEGKSLIEDEVKECFRIIENEEFLKAIVDSEDKVLFGIYRATGKPYFPNHEMYSVITNEEWLYAIIDAEDKFLGGFRANDGHMIVGGIDISTFISNAIIDIEDIKERTAHLYTIDNDEYLSVETDAEGKVIGYIAPDGSHYLYKVKSETIPTEFEHIEDLEERMEITTDAEDKVIGYRDSRGTRHELALDSKSYAQDGKEYDLSKFDTGNVVDTKINKAVGSISIMDIDGVKDHSKQNLLKPSECTPSYTDGTNTFTPPNAGYILSNPIECKAGESFTRTGTATGMVVVSDKNDRNAQRLMPNGQLPGSTVQIPYDWTWASFIRFAVQKSSTKDLIISKGNYTIEKKDSGDFCTIDNLKIQAFNLSNDAAYIKATDGKYFELYIDADDGYSIKAREIDVSIIQPNNLPSDWVSFTYSGTFNGLFDRFVICNNKYLLELSERGITKLKSIGVATMAYNNAEHFYDEDGNGRYATSLQGSQRKDTLGVGFCLFDENMILLEKDLNAIGQTVTDSNWSEHLPDHHDFIYIEDGHYIFFEIDWKMGVNVEGFGAININGFLVHEIKKINGEYKVIGEFSTHDYPKLYTDIYGNKGVNIHMNTLGLDYDGNLIMNFRDCNSFIKVKRVVNPDGTVTIGSKTKNYEEAIIGRVGGIKNIGYLDSKRVLPKDFSFTNQPSGLEASTDPMEDWEWFHSHDVKYWGMKEINGKQYPTYTMFDNNYWTSESYGGASVQNKRNNYQNNPKCNGLRYDSSNGSDENYKDKTISRLIQISIDWENKKIIDYKIYKMPEYFSQEMCGATMLTEGVFAVSFSYMGIWGVYDFVSDLGTTTILSGKTYSGAKKLFEAKYDTYRYCYRANVYKLK